MPDGLADEPAGGWPRVETESSEAYSPSEEATGAAVANPDELEVIEGHPKL